MEPFSRRYGFAGEPEELVYDGAPESLRYGILSILEKELSLIPSRIREIVCTVLRVRTDPNNWSEYPNIWDEVQDLFYGCEWYKVYDVCEGIYSALERSDVEWVGTANGSRFLRSVDELKGEFQDKVNALFRELGIGYEMRNGRLERRTTALVDLKIVQARELLLSDPRFSGPCEQFERAINCWSLRPRQDSVNAIKEAVGALEGIARIVSGLQQETLGKIVDRFFKNKAHPAICELIDKIWGYSSSQGGIRHGQVAPLSVGEEEADLLLGVTASLILYIGIKRWV